MSTEMPFLPEFDLSSSEPDVCIPQDKKDARYLLAHFLISEIYFKLWHVQEFVEAVNQVQSGEFSSQFWSENSFEVLIDSSKCSITDFEASTDEQDVISTTELSHDQFMHLLTSWKEYVDGFSLPAS